eukprot:TRINITY_DN7465_c0_g1_i1.p1 TRINITY_DN7465_c0_g1~~TRINITY_DN7465_c0_g1_i1.p1  ORF type:complete len:448 (-),score=92.65 TRINITY_DN7465_c0_g1_i1:61-1404(-)
MTTKNAKERKKVPQNIYDEEDDNVEVKKTPQSFNSTKPHVFGERQSSMDYYTESDFSQGPLRGWFNLFALVVGYYMLLLQYDNLTRTGTFIGIQNIYDWFHRLDMFPAWLCLVFCSFFSPFLEKLIVRGIVAVPLAYIIQSVAEVALVVGATTVAVKANWPLVPTIFFLAETLILFMKMHSYFFTNRELQMAVKEKKSEITSRTTTQWPQNVTWFNYVDFLVVPPLVYEIEYPRTPRIRPAYLASKIIAFAGLWTVLHLVVSKYVIPIFEKLTEIPLWLAVAQLSIPILFCGILIFYIVFDIGLNGFAEITRFADREFYEDWWNSTTFGEFARKWNKPVHEWLLRHVYLQSISQYKMSRKSAMLVTFLFSSIIHEYFMCVSLRMFRPWLFLSQMGHIGLIVLGKGLKGTRTGNLFFWSFMMMGLPVITVAYCREYYFRKRGEEFTFW